MQAEPLSGVADAVDPPAAILEDLLDVCAFHRHQGGADLRLHVRRLTERVAPQLVVLSYHEVPQQFKVQSLGMIEVPVG